MNFIISKTEPQQNGSLLEVTQQWIIHLTLGLSTPGPEADCLLHSPFSCSPASERPAVCGEAGAGVGEGVWAPERTVSGRKHTLVGGKGVRQISRQRPTGRGRAGSSGRCGELPTAPDNSWHSSCQDVLSPPCWAGRADKPGTPRRDGRPVLCSDWNTLECPGLCDVQV